MGGYNEYLRRKAFLDFYSRLSDNDKRLLAQMSNPVKNDVMGKTTEIDCRDPYWRGVSQNIVGDAIYDIGIHLLKRLIRLK